MNDYYSLLGLKPGATHGEIKSAFREKAKRRHPDVSASGSDREMRELLEAYETLSNAERRREYDIKHREYFSRYVFDYHAFLLEDIDNPETKAKLIFFDLLHGYDDEAIEVWFAASKNPQWSLDRHLDREDAMDFSFILAEELEKRSHFPEAFRLYLYIVREEAKKPYFKHFFPEVIARMKDLTRLRLPKTMGDAALIPYLETMLTVGLVKRELAWYVKRLAELKIASGDAAGARSLFASRSHVLSERERETLRDRL